MAVRDAIYSNGLLVDTLILSTGEWWALPNWSRLTAPARSLLIELSIHYICHRCEPFEMADHMYVLMGMESPDQLDDALVQLVDAQWIRLRGREVDFITQPWHPDTMKGLTPDRDVAGHVYVLRAETGEYKIGRSKNPPKRHRAIGTKMPVPVEMLHHFKCEDSFASELALHRALERERIRGEWFDLAPDIVERLCRVSRSKTFDEPMYRLGGRWVSASQLVQ